MPVKNEPVGKLVMVSQSQRDMLVDIDDVFVSHLFTYGIQFDCDFWEYYQTIHKILADV